MLENQTHLTLKLKSRSKRNSFMVLRDRLTLNQKIGQVTSSFTMQILRPDK